MKKKCDLCGKDIKGRNEKMADVNLKIHLLTQHSDKVRLEAINGKS